MHWEKVGKIFTTLGQHSWMQSHASVPFAEHLQEDIYRIYFTPRDEQNRSHIAFLDIDLKMPQDILNLSSEPLLAPGPPGSFDEGGVMGSWLLQDGKKRYLYYIGWSKRVTVPFHTAIGLAISDNGGAFERLPGPVLDRNPYDPYFVSTPCVLKEGNLWKMWYLSGLGWQAEEGNVPWSPYHLHYAESVDGLCWKPYPQPVLEFAHPDEVAIARPCVRPCPHGYEMWYCYRGTSFTYRMGYALSLDGINWVRHDQSVGLTASTEGWDAEMIAYPYVFNHQGQTYMLYCGNGFSQGGVGLAKVTAPFSFS
jgi:hypothetical protein